MELAEYLFKVIVIGEANVGEELPIEPIITRIISTGKTSIIKRYVNGEFSHKYKYTIGGTNMHLISGIFRDNQDILSFFGLRYETYTYFTVDFALKQIQWDENTTVRLQVSPGGL